MNIWILNNILTETSLLQNFILKLKLTENFKRNITITLEEIKVALTYCLYYHPESVLKLHSEKYSFMKYLFLSTKSFEKLRNSFIKKMKKLFMKAEVKID